MEASMRPLTIPLAIALSAAVGPLAGPLAVAQTSRAASAPEMKLWRTPWEGARPRDPFADQKGNVWFVGQAGNFVGRLDPKTGEFKRFEVESGTHPHNLVVDAKGQVWFTGTGGSSSSIRPRAS
jgi:virginiamycin B lyase